MFRRKKRRESGAFAIEAVLALTTFMLAVLGLMMGSMIVRAQASMQFALNQTAKELSGYFYLLDKFGIASVLSGASTDVTNETLESLNGAAGHIMTFAGELEEKGEEYKSLAEENKKKLEEGTLTADDLNAFRDVTDVDQLKAEAKSLKDELVEIAKSDNKIEMLKSLFQVFGRAAINSLFSKYVAPVVCETLMPKYLTSGDPDVYYRKLGIDPESVTFEGSQLLADGRTISLVVTYKMDAKKLTLGMYDKDLYFQQVASTAAWLVPNDSGSVKSLKAVGQAYVDGAAEEEGGGEGGEGGTPEAESGADGEDSKDE